MKNEQMSVEELLGKEEYVEDLTTISSKLAK